MMWRCLVEKNVRVGQISNIGCGSEHRPVVMNNHKLEEKYEKEYKGIVRKQQLWLDVMYWFQGYFQSFSGSPILCLAAGESSIMDDFHLGRPVSLLVNTPDHSRNLLRVAMSYFVPSISGIYIELETLWRIWRQFSYWEHILITCLHICISSL